MQKNKSSQPEKDGEATGRSPLLTLLLEEPVFSVLKPFFHPQSPAKEWHLRALVRETSLNLKTVDAYLERFEKQGVLCKRLVGNRHVYSPNSQSDLANELTDLFAYLAGVGARRAVPLLPEAAPFASLKRLYWYKTAVERVVDGDTFVALVDLGFHTLRRLRIRVARVDAPPLAENKGKEVTEYVRTLIEGKEVLIRTFGTDRYGRWIADVYVEKKLLAAMLSEKFGLPLLKSEPSEEV